MSPIFRTAAATLLFTALSNIAISGDFINAWERKSSVSDTVTDNLDGTWTYEYTVFNNSTTDVAFDDPNATEGEPVIIDWELPWFDDAGIDLGSILSPLGWNFEIETIGVANATTGWDGTASWQDPSDPFHFPDSPFNDLGGKVLHWYVSDLIDCRPDDPRDAVLSAPSVASIVTPMGEPLCAGIISNESIQNDFGFNFHQNSLSGFSFVAAFEATDAPYQASWLNLPVRSGDPAFPFGALPNSPTLRGDVPTPAPLILLASGLLLALRFRKKLK